MAGDALKERGWYLSEDGIVQCTQNGKNDVNSLIKVALDTDLREIGQGWLPEDINRGKAEYVEGPGVLQLQKIRNVSAPKDNEESQAAPRLMKLVLTDGHTNCTAVETETIKDIGSNTAPGSKIKLKVTTAVEHGFLLLNNKNTQLLGGRVDKLAEGWELKKKLAKQQRSTFGEGGPPPFVPFGKRIESNHYRNPSKRDNFKSLESNKGEKKGENEDEFEQQRKATIAEALQAKEDSSSKRFGGGQKQVNSDHDIARITEMGFRAEEASAALKSSNGNVQQAIESLLSNRRGPAGRGGPSRQYSNESRDSDRGMGRGRRERREEDEGPGRVRKGRDFDQGDESHSRPSGPATLFDFLETKMPIKESKDSKKEKDIKTEESASSHTSSSDKTRSQDRDRPRMSGQNQSDSWSQSSRRPLQQQQDIPPRFVNKKQEDQSHRQGGRENKFREDRPKTAPTDFKNSDRNYSDRNYNDRKYNDRNFNDRNYSDRRYNERNYNDRNYERNYNDRSYNERNYNERNYKDRNFNDKNYYDKSYSDKNYSGRGERKDNQRDNERRDNFRRDDKGGKDSQNTRDTRQNYDKQSDNYQKTSYSSKPSASNAKTDQSKEGKSNQGQGQGQSQDVDKLRPPQNQQPSRNTSQSNNSQPPPPQKYNQHQRQDESRTNQGQDQSRTNQGNFNKPEKYSSKSYNKDTPPYKKENQNFYNNSGQVYNSTANSQQIYVQENYSQANMSANFQPQNPHNFQTSASLVTYNANGSYVNPPMNMELQMSTGPPQYTQPPADSAIYTVSQVQISFKQGDRVMAKYWEDGLFYEAVIESVWPNLPTCIVMFVEYGNSEEVLLSDIRPMISALMAGQPSPIAVPQPDLSVPPPQVFYTAQPPQISPIDDITNAIGSMEFRRGGSGPMYSRKQDNRPQQQFYQPPAQRR